MKYIYYALLLSGLAITIIRWRRLDRSLHLFVPLYIAALVTQAIVDKAISDKAIVDKTTVPLFLYHINQAIETILLFSYYYLLLAETRLSKWIWVALALYLVYFTAYFIRFPTVFFKFDPIDLVVEGAFITLFSLYYLIELYRSQEQVRFFNYPHFWIAAGNLIFYSGASFFMGFAHTLSKNDKTLYAQLAPIVEVLNLMLYSIYIKGLLCPSPEKRPN